MRIELNGRKIERLDDITLARLLGELPLGSQMFAVEVNCEVAPRSEYERYIVKEGDKIEIIRAVGGG